MFNYYYCYHHHSFGVYDKAAQMKLSTPFLSINVHNGKQDFIPLPVCMCVCFLYLNFILFTSFDWQLKLLQFKVFFFVVLDANFAGVFFVLFVVVVYTSIYTFIFTVRALAHLFISMQKSFCIRLSLYLIISTLKISQRHLQNQRRKNNLS